MGNVTKPLAYLPTLPAVQQIARPEPAGLGVRDLLKPRNSATAVAPPSLPTDPNALVSSALSILAGEKLVSSPLSSSLLVPSPLVASPLVASPGLDVPMPQLPPLRADASPANVGPQTQPTFLPLQLRTLGDGSLCTLPIRYFDAQLLIATYLTDYGRAAALLKDTGVVAVPQMTGQALVAFGCFQYRKTDIGAYNEVGVAILATSPISPVPALYVVHLPVNTAVANRAGHEIWGYNKFVASIDIAETGDAFAMTIRDPSGVTIARFNGTRGASVTMPPNDIVTFSILDGRLMRTVIQMMTPSQVGSGSGFSLQIGESTHPMAENLRSLGLDSLTPTLLQYAEPFQSMLFPGQIA
jgi:Acetoacetate decarboxylase (ADC)